MVEESKRLYIGQSLDLHWTGNLVCPSVAEYIKALDDSMLFSIMGRNGVNELDAETGGLIRMLTRLLEATSPLAHKPNVRALTVVLGRCYGLRDDYKNISSTEVSKLQPPDRTLCVHTSNLSAVTWMCAHS